MPKIWNLFAIALFAAPAAADVSVVRSVQSDGFGGFGASTKVTTTWISSDKHRQETKSEGKPSMMEKLAGTDRPEITRLDKKVRWRLNQPKKTYEENPLVLPTTPGEKSESANEEASSKSEPPTTRISKVEFKVTPLGQKKTVASRECTGYQLRSLLETEDLETHKKTELRMLSTFWTAPEQGEVAKLKQEEAAYAQAYAKALGMTDAVQNDLKMLGGAMLASLAGSGEKELSQALAGIPAEMKKIKGYPLLTRVEWYTQTDDEAAGGNEKESEAIDVPTDASDAISSLAGGFLKKKMEAKRPAPTADGQLVIGMTSEVKSILTEAIPPSTFDVPAGFKKKP